MLTMIYDLEVTGHHLEYIHHLYQGALNQKTERFVFYLPPDFEEKKKNYEWEKAENISFRYFSEDELHSCTKGNLLHKAWNTSRLLRRKALELKCNRVLLISFIELLLFICILLPGRIKVSGIVYRIYLYNQEKMSRMRLMLEKFRYTLAVKSKCIERIFILNDEGSVRELNALYSTSKFHYLQDPVPLVDKSQLVNLRKEYNIPEENKLFLHFGGLSRRKGTLNILKAIISTDDKLLEKMSFIIAGRVYDDIKSEFYELMSLAEKKTQILTFDKFCSYEFLYNACYTSDVILMPYQLTNLSSGVLGYASLFQKPVIGPSDGLIGKLISSYHLGIMLKELTVDELQKAMLTETMPELTTFYAENNSLERFTNTLLNVEN